MRPEDLSGDTTAAADAEREPTTGGEAQAVATVEERDEILAAMGATGKPETEEPDAEADPGHDELPPETKARIEARIGKEVGKRKALEEKLTAAQEEAKAVRDEAARLKQELDETKSASNKGDGTNPLFAAESEDDIQKRQEELLDLKAWYRRHTGGYEGDGTVKDRSLTSDEVAERLEMVERELEISIPKARKLLGERQKVAQVIEKAYPGLKLDDPRSPAAIEIARRMRASPALKADPEAKLLILDAMYGRLLRERRSSAGRKDTPPRIGGGGVTRTTVVDGGVRKGGLNDEVLKKGGYTREALQRALENQGD